MNPICIKYLGWTTLSFAWLVFLSLSCWNTKYLPIMSLPNTEDSSNKCSFYGSLSLLSWCEGLLSQVPTIPKSCMMPPRCFTYVWSLLLCCSCVCRRGWVLVKPCCCSCWQIILFLFHPTIILWLNKHLLYWSLM